ncbi:Non-catalytic module family DOC2 [Piromyces sp. E2]|nr:Non-catalytic module family DOC2 [Piromyces sp. E2]|eukprot:OUM61596.1 Non-catalytic module family DOC2 [Piromyces sp. E2]
MKFSKFIALAIFLVVTNFVAADITLTAGPVTCEYKKKDTNESYDATSDVSIKCNGTSCTVNGNGATSSNGIVNISAAGTYIVQGSLQGQIRIEATENDFIHLVLNSATISSSSGPAIYGMNADKITITLVGNNKLTDTTNYTVVDEEPDACLFIDADLSINGSGSLSVTGNYSDAIRCKKDLKLVSGQITVPKATQKGIKAKNSICIMDASIDVTSTDSGIKVTRDDNPDKGFIVIDGGDISVSTGNKGIHAETHLTIRGGFIDIKNSKEGLEGQMIDILGGEIHMLSTDDGINASKISSDTSSTGGWGGMGMGGSTDGSVYVNIVGGKTFITVQGNDLDGIDANGVLYIGGNAEVYVSNQGGAIYGNMAAFDADGSNSICSGATVIGTAGGSSGGGRWKRQFQRPGQGGQGGPGGPGGMGESGSVYQPYIQTSITSQSAGTTITIKDSNNNIIASFTPINAYSSILVTSPQMVAGQTYTIVTGNTSQTAKASAAASGTVNPPSVTSPDSSVTSSSTATRTKTIANSQPTQNSSSCSSSILNQGYKCCSSSCTVIYTDSDGTWGVENGEWCGCSPSSTSNEKCPSVITSQGYSCCSSNNCNVYYVDESGNWGVENNQWCGISYSC